MVVIAIAGNKGVGKSTAAAVFKERGFKELNFADLIKRTLRERYPSLTDEQLYGSKKEVYDMDLGATPRELMQQLGDELKKIDKHIFINAVLDIIKRAPGNYVIADMRFVDEFNALHEAGATVVYIKREQANIQFGNHNSELEPKQVERLVAAHPGRHHILLNEGTVEQLYEKMLHLFINL